MYAYIFTSTYVQIHTCMFMCKSIYLYMDANFAFARVLCARAASCVRVFTRVQVRLYPRVARIPGSNTSLAMVYIICTRTSTIFNLHTQALTSSRSQSETFSAALALMTSKGTSPLLPDITRPPSVFRGARWGAPTLI